MSVNYVQLLQPTLQVLFTLYRIILLCYLLLPAIGESGLMSPSYIFVAARMLWNDDFIYQIVSGAQQDTIPRIYIEYELPR